MWPKVSRITHGHNKDHRPDLKQLLWILTVSADGNVPIHYRICDGNTNDDPTHIDTWNTLRQLVGRCDFLYVADCKLCNRAAMDHIAGQGGRFITVLPRSRKEDAWFREYLQTHPVEWEEVIRRPNPRNRNWSPDVWRVTEAPIQSAEGYRVIWVHSLLMAEADQRARLSALQKALTAMEALNERLAGPRSRLRQRASVHHEVAKILESTGVARWANIEVLEHIDHQYKQATRGRPGAKTRYLRQQRPRFSLQWKPHADVIAYDARSDGMYPFITNCKDLSPAKILERYKLQPRLEKRHEQLKTVYAVAPAFLKNEGRIEALLLLYFLALLVQALMEREVRQRMSRERIPSLPLYPEERECRAPTANRILEVFEPLQRHDLLRESHIHQSFAPHLTTLHQTLLHLLGVPRHVYPSVR